jgi:hypothetical protein
LNEAGFNKRKQLADQQTQKSRSIGVGGASPAIKEKGKGKKSGETKKRARDSGIESVSSSSVLLAALWSHWCPFAPLGQSVVVVIALTGRKVNISRNQRSKSLSPMY